ncbi:MAG: TetR/AcrR family transcriptional regulator [Solirubrobacteraceae bacterium]
MPSPSPRTAIATRRTQEERRAETRSKLLDATIRSLLDVGYAATTTRRVAELAGVSQGAQTHHFPHRVDLVAAAVARLADRRIAELHELAGEFPSDREQRLRALLDLLWADFSSDTFTVYVKLWVAAADDSELYERMVPIERRIARATVELALSLAGDLTDLDGWERHMQLALTVVRGLALTEQFEPRGRRRRDPWPDMRDALIEAFRAIGAERA